MTPTEARTLVTSLTDDQLLVVVKAAMHAAKSTTLEMLGQWAAIRETVDAAHLAALQRLLDRVLLLEAREQARSGRA